MPTARLRPVTLLDDAASCWVWQVTYQAAGSEGRAWEAQALPSHGRCQQRRQAGRVTKLNAQSAARPSCPAAATRHHAMSRQPGRQGGMLCKAGRYGGRGAAGYRWVTTCLPCLPATCPGITENACARLAGWEGEGGRG